MHGSVNAEPGKAPLHVDVLGGLGPVKGADMHAAHQNPAPCAAARFQPLCFMCSA